MNEELEKDLYYILKKHGIYNATIASAGSFTTTKGDVLHKIEVYWRTAS